MNKFEIPKKIERLMKKYKSSYGSVYDTFNDELYIVNNKVNNLVGVLDQIDSLQNDYVCDSDKGYQELELIRKWIYYIYSSQYVGDFIEK